jgi:hypothetical protein
MPYIAPLKHKLRASTNADSDSLHVVFKCRVGHFPDGQDNVFKKMTTPWCHHRPVWSPDLWFHPTSDRRGHSEGHGQLDTPSRRDRRPQASPSPASVAVLSLAFAKPDFRPGQTP